MDQQDKRNKGSFFNLESQLPVPGNLVQSVNLLVGSTRGQRVVVVVFVVVVVVSGCFAVVVITLLFVVVSTFSSHFLHSLFSSLFSKRLTTNESNTNTTRWLKKKLDGFFYGKKYAFEYFFHSLL